MILGRIIRFISHLISRIDLSFGQKKYFRAVAFMLLLTTYLPIVYKNIPSVFGSHHLYVLIWFGSVLIFSPKLFSQKKILYLIFYGLLIVGFLLNTLWMEMDLWNKSTIQDEFYVFIVAISVIVYFLMEKDYEGLAWVTKWSIIFIGITAILTLYSLSIDPMYIRKSSAGDILALTRMEKLGGGGYAYISALVALFPLMIYYFQKQDKSIFSRKIIVLYGLLCLFTIVRAQIFANILLSFVIIAFSFLGREKLIKSIVTISFFVLVFLLIPKSIYAELLIDVSSYFDPDSNVYYKLTDMATYFVSGDRYVTSADAHAARYPMLLEAFAENPLFGYSWGDPSKYNAEGGHIYWMNKLTVLGLFGFIPLLLIHIGYIKSGIKLFSKDYTFYFLISVFAVIGLGLMKALIGRELWFAYFVLLPGAYFLPLLNKRKQKQSEGKVRNRKKVVYKGSTVSGIDNKSS